MILPKGLTVMMASGPARVYLKHEFLEIEPDQAIALNRLMEPEDVVPGGHHQEKVIEADLELRDYYACTRCPWLSFGHM